MDMIRTTLRQVGDALRALHRDERGAEGIEKLLILAAVALPLLGILIFFGEAIQAWVGERWEAQERKSDALETDANPFTN